jgi:hypothetical protein
LVAGILGRRPDSRLTRTLKGDPHLGSFCSTPGKDNGLDIEGLAVVGDRLLLGLRGPVLRGWAVVLEVTVEGAGGRGREEAEDLQLASRYRKHFLELDGLGVRELCVDGDDLLVLAGPTMNLDGPVRVYRWTAGARGGGTGLVRRDALGVVCDLPYGEGEDHAEGFARFGSAASETPAMLVVFDSPSGARRPKNPGDRTLADVFPWDDRASPGRRHGPRIDFAG